MENGKQPNNNFIIRSTNPFIIDEKLADLTRLLFDVAVDIILILDENGFIISANQKAINWYGYRLEELLNLRIFDIRHPTTWKDFDSQMVASELNGILYECIHCKKDGSCFPVEVSSRSIWIDGQLFRVHIVRDISDRKRNEMKLIHLAHYDPLTGIENRSSIVSTLVNVQRQALSQSSSFAVVMIDLDKFKLVNDNYGHLVGDEVLKIAAHRIKSALRQDDNIGRYGGDEFLLIQQNIKNQSNILPLIQRIFGEFESPCETNGLSLPIRLSAGISIFPNDKHKVTDLIHCADQAMYAAKKIDGNSYAFYGDLITDYMIVT